MIHYSTYSTVFFSTPKFLVCSKKASEMISMDALFKPFDGIVWLAIGALLFAQTTFLVAIRRILGSMTFFMRFGNDYSKGICQILDN